MTRPRRTETRRSTPSDQYVGMFWMDPSIIDGKEWHYVFIELTVLGQETQSLERAMAKGYEPVKVSEIPGLMQSEVAKIRGRKTDDDYVRRGDQILMRCPRSLYEERRADLAKESKRQMNRVEWASLGEKLGAPTFVERNEYSRSQEQAFAGD